MRPALLVALSALLVHGCASPPPPDWELRAHAELQAFSRHYLDGETRAAEQAFQRAREAVSRTGRFDLLARAELVRCAHQVASLDFSPCSAFDALRADAQAEDLAYAAFIEGRAAPAAREHLPERYRALVDASGDAYDRLAAIGDPRSRLIAAGALLRAARLPPQGLRLAIATAEAQGWRRPLVAWLAADAERAERAGDHAAAAMQRRRIELVVRSARERK